MSLWKSNDPISNRALEAVLQSVIAELEETKDSLLPPVEALLESMAQHVNREKLLELLEFKRRITKFGNQVTSLSSTLKALLNNDEDLAGSYLTETERGTSRNISDHIEIEFLLEHYLARVEGLSLPMRLKQVVLSLMASPPFSIDLAFIIQEVSEGRYIQFP